VLVRRIIVVVSVGPRHAGVDVQVAQAPTEPGLSPACFPDLEGAGGIERNHEVVIVAVGNVWDHDLGSVAAVSIG